MFFHYFHKITYSIPANQNQSPNLSQITKYIGYRWHFLPKSLIIKEGISSIPSSPYPEHENEMDDVLTGYLCDLCGRQTRLIGHQCKKYAKKA